MNIKEQAVKNLLVSLFGNGTKDLKIKSSITFDLVASFKEDGDGSVNVTVNRNDVDAKEDTPIDVPRKTNGEGWDSVEI